MLLLLNDTLEAICSHSQREYPKECCGILLGTRESNKRTVVQIVPVKNMAKEGQNTTHFYINPLELVQTERLAEEEGLEIVGFYHSHPDYEAVASKLDCLHMIAGYSYPILSVIDGRCEKVNSFTKKVQTDLDVKKERIAIV